MTKLDGVPDLVPTIQPVSEVFTGNVSALWATTYNVDLGLFNEFLLPRLGEPPLNVVVLADHRRLATSLERLPPERTDALAAVNRRWLLRGLRPGGQAFHPKTYLAVTGERATLLVGSGNLSTSGLDDGHEVFTRFGSGTAVGDAAIDSWRAWMRRLVAMVGDVTLAERFRDLENRLPARPSVAPAEIPPLLHNLDVPIAEQLGAIVRGADPGPIDDLLLLAPFYDDDAAAVERLLNDLQPRRVRVYVTSSTSVNGDHLATRLAACNATVDVVGLEPDGFVHAKLVGVIAGHRAWLLSGSANLSQAALTRTTSEHGNVELDVLAPMEPDRVPAVFTPPGMSTVGRDLAALGSLSFRADSEPAPPAVRLASAARTIDDRVAVVSDPSALDGWYLDDLATRQPLVHEPSGRALTQGPLAGRLVQLVDPEGATLSNRVVVDDPQALAAALTTSGKRPEGDRPPELLAGDLDTPLAQALVWLHRNLVMDVSEQTTSAPTGGVGADEANDQGDDDLWERLEKEQLARDPRASTYRRMWQRNAIGGTEPIIELLEALRARTPSEPKAAGPGRSILTHLLDDREDQAEKPEKPARRWKVATRIRVRARNVLSRWAAAQTDPRLVWVDPLAPAGNFAMIAATLAQLRLDKVLGAPHVELTEDDLDDLWLRWLRPFAGTGAGDGWLDQLDSAALTLARDRLPDWLPEVATALCWLAVRPGSGQRERVIAFQAVLAAALHHDLVEPTDATARYLSVVNGYPITRSKIDDRLLEVVEFIDDDLWCERTAAEFGLSKLTLRAPPGAATMQLRLDVLGINDPLLDPCVPRLVDAARRYRRCDGVALFSADGGWRMAFASGETIAFLRDKDGSFVESAVVLSDGVLEQLAASSGVLADLFPPNARVA